jgi:hypothetical protein
MADVGKQTRFDAVCFFCIQASLLDLVEQAAPVRRCSGCCATIHRYCHRVDQSQRQYIQETYPENKAVQRRDYSDALAGENLVE